MHTFTKIILVLFIAGGGAAITCGGNIFLANQFGPKNVDYPILHPFFIGLWIIEILALLYYGAKIVNSRFQDVSKKNDQKLFFLSLGCVILIISVHILLQSL